MKKLISLLMIFAMTATLLVGCGQSSDTENSSSTSSTSETTSTQPEESSSSQESSSEPTEEITTIRLGGLKGPTSMGMVKLLSDAEQDKTQNHYEFQMAGSADELTPLLLKGELDILAVPANLGSILYNNSKGSVEFLAVNTLGVIYIVESGGQTITDWESLKGKTILATGKGSTPEYALNYLLSQYGLDPATDVTIEWKSEPTEVVAQMATMENAVAMLPQPFVTVAKSQLEDFHVAIDLTEEWNALNNGSQLITAGLVVRKQFAEEHPDAITKFLEEYAQSTDYVNNHVAEAAQLVEKYDIVKAAIAEQAIPACNIVCIAGEEMKPMVAGYFEVLYEQNPDSVGGALPGDDFYYVE